MGDDGLIAGRYRLIARLGSGGMGEVWQAYDERLHRTVAVKKLLMPAVLTGPQTEEATRLAMREGRLTAKFQHPNSIMVYDVAELNGQPYLVMEYLPSMSLSQVLAARGPMPPAEVAEIGARVAEALAAAHAAGVVHRDVKPGNVLLGDDGTVKITDFGISRAVEDVTKTNTGVIVGTPAYLAPEVAKGERASFASDVFSLGATLYTAIEGTPPFGTSDNAMALLYRVASGELRPPTHAGPMTEMLLRLLRLDPEQRPTMAEAGATLAALAEGLRADAEPTAFIDPSPPPATRDAGVVGAGAGVVGAGVVGAGAGAAGARAAGATDAELAGAGVGSAAGVAGPEAAGAAGVASPGAGAAGAGAAGVGAAANATRVAPSVADEAPAARFAPRAWPAPRRAPARTPAERRRRRAGLVALGLAVLALAAIGLVLALDRGQPGRGAAATQSTAPGAPPGVPPAAVTTTPPATTTPVTTSPAAPAQQPPAQQPTQRPPAQQPPAQQPPAQQPPAGGSPQTAAAAIVGYYALMPDNLQEGWTWLTPKYQQYPAGGYSGYQNFWNQMSGVRVYDVVQRQSGVVEASVEYTFKTGKVVRERHRYVLVYQGGRWLIDESTVLSSVTL